MVTVTIGHVLRNLQTGLKSADVSLLQDMNQISHMSFIDTPGVFEIFANLEILVS